MCPDDIPVQDFHPCTRGAKRRLDQPGNGTLAGAGQAGEPQRESLMRRHRKLADEHVDGTLRLAVRRKVYATLLAGLRLPPPPALAPFTRACARPATDA